MVLTSLRHDGALLCDTKLRRKQRSGSGFCSLPLRAEAVAFTLSVTQATQISGLLGASAVVAVEVDPHVDSALTRAA